MQDQEISYEELWDDVVTEHTLVVRDQTVRVSCNIEQSETSEFGDELWPGAIALAQYVANSKEFATGMHVIEIGAGRCGLPGLAAAAHGCQVTLCDLEENLMSLEANAKMNPGRTRVQGLRWAAKVDVSGLEEADIMLASDVVYRENLVAPLICTLRRLRPKRILLANEERSGNQRRFARTLNASGFNVTAEFSLANSVHMIDALPAERWQLEVNSSMPVAGPCCLSLDQDSRLVDGLGGRIWPGAVALAHFVLNFCHGKRVLELGAGSGYCGIVVATVASEVVLTDEFLDLLAHNVAKSNYKNILIRHCLWGEEPSDPDSFDIILGAELTPMIDGHEALAQEIFTVLTFSSSRMHTSAQEARAFLTAAPCSSVSDQDSTLASCRCTTHRFLRTAVQAGLHLRHCHTHVPIPPDIVNLDRTLDDGTDFIWVLEMELLRNNVKGSRAIVAESSCVDR